VIQPGGSRVLVALGGNALTPGGDTRPQAQEAAVQVAMRSVAELVAGGYDVALTHGNGPQVGNLLVKNELSAEVVPAVPLDWCVAQTQATIGYLIVTALESELRQRNVARPVVAVVTRVRVEPDDPAWRRPSKPIGRFLDRRAAAARIEAGERWIEQGRRGWRRVVPSPEPAEILDADAPARLLDEGAVVVAAGGGGIAMVREADGRLRGAEAVLDKDLSAVLLATSIGADCLCLATDVPGAATGFGTPRERWLGRVDVKQLRELDAAGHAGHFSPGSMGPKVEACARFVERSGKRAVICSLESVVAAVHGRAGTRVEAGASGEC
jgi:carbamate kinase